MRAVYCTADKNNFPAENSSGMLFTAESFTGKGTVLVSFLSVRRQRIVPFSLITNQCAMKSKSTAGAMLMSFVRWGQQKKSPSQQLCSHSFIAKGFSYIKGEYENLIERKGDGENLSLSFAYMDIIHHDY